MLTILLLMGQVLPNPAATFGHPATGFTPYVIDGGIQTQQPTEVWNWTEKAEHHAAIVRVTAGNAGGTGTHVGGGVILTASHVTEGHSQARCQWASGRTTAARVLNCAGADLAALITTPPEDAVAIPISDVPAAEGDEIEICGFGGPTNRLRHFSASCRGTDDEGKIVCTSAVISGDSGGAFLLTNPPRLVGVVSGGSHRSQTGVYEGGSTWNYVHPPHGVHQPLIRRFISRFTQCEGGYCQPPQYRQPPPSGYGGGGSTAPSPYVSPPASPTKPTKDYTQDIDDLRKSINELKDAIGAIQAGPPGPQGPRGLPGLIGPKGDPGEVDYSKLRREVIDNLLPITIEIVDKDGKVVQSDTVSLGGTVRLSLKPVPVK